MIFGAIVFSSLLTSMIVMDCAVLCIFVAFILHRMHVMSRDRCPCMQMDDEDGDLVEGEHMDEEAYLAMRHKYSLLAQDKAAIESIIEDVQREVRACIVI
jgi:hypothetical protein